MGKVHSIKFKLILTLIAIMLSALLFQLFHLAPQFEKSEINAAQETLIFTADNIAAELNLQFKQAITELEKMAVLSGMYTTQQEEMDRMILTFNAVNSFFNYFFIMDKNGAWISYPTQADLVGTRIPRKNMYWVEKIFSNGTTTYLDLIQSNLGTLVSGLATPIYDKNGQTNLLLRGVFVISDDNYLINTINNYKIGMNGFAYLVASNGSLLIHPMKDLEYDNFQSYNMLNYEPVKKALRGETGITTYSYEGEQWLASYQQVPITGWTLIVQQKMAYVLKRAQSKSRLISLLILIIFFFIFTTIIIIISRALKPLSHLVEQIKAGTIPSTKSYSKNEIGELTLQYNQLYNDLYVSNEKTKKTEARFRAIFNNANDGIFFHDLSGKIIEVNQIACDRLGYSRDILITMNIRGIHSSASLPFIEKKLKELHEKKSILFETEHLTKAGVSIPIEINSRSLELDNNIAILSIVRDLSERKEAENTRKKLELQFLHAQKMEALGTLSGGIAHDFNNLLMGIQATISIIQHDLIQDKITSVRLKDIEELVQRGVSLTRQLLGLARGGKYELHVININNLLKRSASLFGRTKKEIRVHFNLENDLWSIEVDQGQMEQVFLNLYVNAWQAMPDGGDLYLGTKNIIIEQEHGEEYSIPTGKCVKITITDTGKGIDDSIIHKIFDPFFTTKQMGKGSGLGLASSYSIIRNHNGTITVYSEKEKGTTFNIYLPATNKKLDEQTSIKQKIPRGTETILLVDDEPMIVNAGKDFLSMLGYKIITAASGREAVKIFETKKEKIDLVILDMIMPDMGGCETFVILKEMEPTIKVLLSSGYSINGQAQNLLDQGCNGFIQKPFSLSVIAQRIRAILDT